MPQLPSKRLGVTENPQINNPNIEKADTSRLVNPNGLSRKNFAQASNGYISPADNIIRVIDTTTPSVFQTKGPQCSQMDKILYNIPESPVNSMYATVR